jgi:PAS domain S-box-containing protein
MSVADLWEHFTTFGSPRLRGWPACYGLAVLAVTAATILQLGLHAMNAFPLAFTLYYPAVVLVAMLAGFGPGIVTTVLSSIAGAYFFLEPRSSFQVKSVEDLVVPAMFAVIGVFLTTLSCSRTQARQALRVSEAELNRAQAVAHIGSWHYDIAQGTLKLSDEAYRILELPFQAPFSLQQGREMVQPEELARLESAWTAALPIGTYDEASRITIAGQTRWLRIQANIERDAQGAPAWAVGTVQDITEHRLAEQRLEEFERVVESLEEMIIVFDRDYRYVIANQAFLKYRGLRKEQVIGHLVPEMVDPEVFQKTLKPRIDECFGGKVVQYELRYKYPTLGERDIFASYFPIGGQGGVDRVACVFSDVTEKKRVSEQLSASEDRYRDLVEHSEDLVCTHDLEGMLLSVNAAPARILGYEVEELLKIPMRDLIVPEGRELFDAYLERFRTTGGAEKGLLRVITRSGEIRDWEYYNTLRTEGVEKPIVRGMAHDVTDRRRAELALQQSEERFKVALKNSPIAVFSQDRDLRYTWIYNLRLLTASEVIGKTDEEIFGVDKARRMRELKQRVVETGAGVREEIVIPYNGTTFTFDMTIEPLWDAQRNIIGITGAAMDVDRWLQLADSLRDAKERLVQEKSYLEHEIQTELGFEEIIGQSPALREVLRKARVVAPSEASVLLLGESGTGKELVARAVHALSSRCDRNFIKLNCAAVPSGLLESELFGHERGAFTGAVSQKVGRVELADKGTLFLDEIGELPPELQPKLLRLLQDREFERLGGVKTLRVDVRIISATNRDLPKEVAERQFREDLFYRLNVFPIQLPPLRERRSDIPFLVHHFVRKHAARMGKSIESVPSETVEILRNWNWPGNIRELENMIERMVILSKGRVLAAPPEDLGQPQEVAEDDLTGMEREHIIRVLRETNGVVSGADGAATRLGLKRTTLQSMLKRFGIELDDFRGTGTLGE